MTPKILNLPNDCRGAARVLAETSTFPTGQSILKDAADEIDRLRAKVAKGEAVAHSLWRILERANSGYEVHVTVGIHAHSLAALTAYREAGQ